MWNWNQPIPPNGIFLLDSEFAGSTKSVESPGSSPQSLSPESLSLPPDKLLPFSLLSIQKRPAAHERPGGASGERMDGGERPAVGERSGRAARRASGRVARRASGWAVTSNDGGRASSDGGRACGQASERQGERSGDG